MTVKPIDSFDVSTLIPHAKPFLFVDHLEALDEETSKVLFKPDKEGLYIRNGLVESHWLIEIFAQAVGVTTAARKALSLDNEEVVPQKGFLIGVEDTSGNSVILETWYSARSLHQIRSPDVLKKH